MAKISIAITDTAKWVAYGPCTVYSIHGVNTNSVGSGDDRYVQFHEKMAADVASSDVPAGHSLYFPGGVGATYNFPKGLDFKELAIAISTAAASYTAHGGSAGLILTAVVESDFLVSSDTTIVGDLTTSVGSLAVWAQGSGARRLVRLDVINNAGSVRYFFASADSGGTHNSEPAWGPVADGASATFLFGKGVTPRLLTTTLVPREGCYIWGKTGPAISDSTYAIPSYNIRAVYDL